MRHAVTNGVVGLLFAVTGPLAILLSVSLRAGLDESLISSWIVASHVIGGGLSIVFSLVYRQPLALAWTIPGAVLLGPALAHLSFAEVVGAYLGTGLVLLVLGVTGWAQRVMSYVPLPLVMAMVAGIFLDFVIDVVEAFVPTPVIAAAMVAAFLLAHAVAPLGRLIPPVLAALAAGAVAVWATQPPGLLAEVSLELARPRLEPPQWSPVALLELVLPLTLTVVAIQNAQGFAILRASGFTPPERRLTMACGVGSLLGGVFGSVSTCVTGPVNGILNSSGPAERRWVGGVVFGVLFALFGTLAPSATQLALSLPGTFISVLGGLALVPVLLNAFTTAFSGPRWRLGALTTFVVTASGITLLRVSAAFWGLVFGLAVSWLLERDDVRALLRERREASGEA